MVDENGPHYFVMFQNPGPAGGPFTKEVTDRQCVGMKYFSTYNQ